MTVIIRSVSTLSGLLVVRVGGTALNFVNFGPVSDLRVRNLTDLDCE